MHILLCGVYEVSGRAMEWAIRQDCAGFTKLVLLALAHHHSFNQPKPFVGFETLAALVGIGEKTARRSVDQLEKLGLISVKRSTGYRANRYILHMEPGQSDHVNPVRESGFKGEYPVTQSQIPGHSDQLTRGLTRFLTRESANARHPRPTCCPLAKRCSSGRARRRPA